MFTLYHKSIKNTLCLFGLVSALGNVDAYLEWLDRWDQEERRQAQADLKALRQLEKLTRKELIRNA